MTKRKWQKRFTASSEGKRTEENLRGVHFFVFPFCYFFSERASCFSFLFRHNFCFTRIETRLWFLLGGMKQAFGGQRMFCYFFFFLWFFPLLNLGKTFEQGLLTGILESQREMGQGEIWKPAALPRKKISMALNCLNISKSNMAWGEKKNRREASSPLHLLKLRRLLGILNQPRQKKRLFSVFIDILPFCSTFLKSSVLVLGVLAGPRS